MEALLLGIYSFFVWLIFIKKKWLPWNTKTQVIVVIIPIVGLTVLVLLLNVFAPSSADVRVIKYVVNVVPQVRGRVLEVPVEPNRPVKKGDVLFRIDPTPYQLQVKTLEAQLVNAEGSAKKLREELNSAVGRTAAVRSKLDLARLRVEQNRELAKSGAGEKFALEQAETNARELDADHRAALAAEAQVRAGLSAVVDDDQAEVAQIKAQLESAKWELSQTTVYAPANGYAINVQLRPGSMTAAFPITPAITFVEDEFQVIALYHQNELHQVLPGNQAEVTLRTHPGEIIKARVDSIVWAQGQGQVPISTTVPQTGVMPIPPGRFPVKLTVDPRHASLFLAAGATGEAAIYTERMAPIHIIRKVILRVGAKLNYIIPKLH